MDSCSILKSPTRRHKETVVRLGGYTWVVTGWFSNLEFSNLEIEYRESTDNKKGYAIFKRSAGQRINE
jgi:hypothetical protein